MSAGDQSFFASCNCWTDPCTTWHPEFYEQPLGAPLGVGLANGSVWTRQFEHANVTLDCSAGTAHIDGWAPPSPAPSPPPPPPLPPKGQWGTPANCTSCDRSGPALQQISVPVSLAACQAACVADANCTAVDFAHHQDAPTGPGCQLYRDCHVAWHEAGCTADEWWTVLLYGR